MPQLSSLSSKSMTAARSKHIAWEIYLRVVPNLGDVLVVFRGSMFSFSLKPGSTVELIVLGKATNSIISSAALDIIAVGSFHSWISCRHCQAMLCSGQRRKKIRARKRIHIGATMF